MKKEELKIIKDHEMFILNLKRIYSKLGTVSEDFKETLIDIYADLIKETSKLETDYDE